MTTEEISWRTHRNYSGNYKEGQEADLHCTLYTIWNSYHEHILFKSKKPRPVLFEILIINTFSFHFQKVKWKARPRVTQIGVWILAPSFPGRKTGQVTGPLWTSAVIAKWGWSWEVKKMMYAKPSHCFCHFFRVRMWWAPFVDRLRKADIFSQLIVCPNNLLWQIFGFFLPIRMW